MELERLIDKLSPDIIAKLNSGELLLVTLMSNGVLTYNEYSFVRHLAQDDKRNAEILYLIRRKERSIFENFLSTLADTGQTGIYHKIKKEFDKRKLY